ncbi:hypothetical protein [Croceitalea rosinachiae]|uniref:Haem-binding uptake Tiki superfamily ChaN domain-containing protein n=1 Tax=Croceitalea rosinachiae TaxID=3075596 RepID=A0ABU3AAD9_9FLAO|nr:hypothetical protein [Croceitalea sp. F388]MDT0607149.1 hypothetical protein [Croceitalea sp. F388]
MRTTILLAILFFVLGCTEKPNSAKTKPKNEVLVLGTIHGGHLTHSIYNIDYLNRLIKEIKPDFILAEIPPDRMEAAMQGFKKDDSISEPRVMRFPEYVDVIFPLTKELGFEIIPTAGWTKPMADERSAKLKAISKDSSRLSDWVAYLAANKHSDSIYKATGKKNDPYFIHTTTYDSIQDIALQTYNRLFNVELGLGGWENINIAHYWNIEKALEKYRYQGKRFLIVYGAGHKGWFLRQLHKRDDITLLEMKPFLEKIDKK